MEAEETVMDARGSQGTGDGFSEGLIFYFQGAVSVGTEVH